MKRNNFDGRILQISVEAIRPNFIEAPYWAWIIPFAMMMGIAAAAVSQFY